MLFILNGIMRGMTERGVGKKVEPPRPVISVGNIHFGGTGKTPHVLHIANFLIENGYTVCVLTRGYKRASSGHRIFLSGDMPASPAQAGDEPFMMKMKIPELILCVGANRRESMKRVLKEVDVDLFLLDDGFQQFHMHKHCDVVLLRYEDIPGLAKRGNHFKMRESPSSLSYADFVIVTKTPPDFEEDAARTFQGRYCQDLEIAITRYRVSRITSNAGPGDDVPADGEFYLFGGLADFSGFLATAAEHGIKVGGHHPLPDHITYSERMIEDLRHRAGGKRLLTSEKDIVKLPFGRFGEVFSIGIEVEFLKGKELLENRILRSVDKR